MLTNTTLFTVSSNICTMIYVTIYHHVSLLCLWEYQHCRKHYHRRSTKDSIKCHMKVTVHIQQYSYHVRKQ